MKISKYYRAFLRLGLNLKNRKYLTNKNFTILCNNCVGGVILHELGERFNTPTIDLFFRADEYVKFLENLEWYLSLELVEISSNYDYPVGELGDITIYFMHYSSFDEAKNAWERRIKRINRENLYVILIQRFECDEEVLKRFDKLPYDHKVALVSKAMKSIRSAYYIPGTGQEDGEVMDLCQYKGKFTGRRWIDDFDFVKFLNQKKCEENVENEKKKSNQ